jgi:uncharacterized membrane protein YvbJ
MKYCPNCNSKYDDLLVVCPECNFNCKEEISDKNRHDSTLTISREEISKIVNRTLFKYSLILFTLFGVSLFSVRADVEEKMRAEIEKNLQQPHIQSIIEEVAKNRASFIIEKYVLPEVSKFEEKVALLLKDIEKLEKEVQARNDRMDFYFKERKKNK